MLMNETPANTQTLGHGKPDITPAGPEQPDIKKTGPRTVLFTLLLVVTLLSAISALYLAYRNRYASFSTHVTQANLVATSEKLGARLEELETQIDQMRETQEATSRSLLDLTRELPGGNEDWALAEIEFLLIIATHHAQLDRNLDATLEAMQTADLRLRGLDNPALDPVREQLTRDISRLKELNGVDTAALALFLGNLANRVNSLPLAGAASVNDGSSQETGVAQGQENTRKDILDTLWRELKSLVVIKHDEEKNQALLLPGQEYFIYQNLRLELENARLSLWRRDTENLHLSATYLQKWLTEYFDTTDPVVTNVMTSLQQLSSINLDPAIPDISSSLESLRAYIREKAESPQNTERRTPGT